MLKQAVYGWCVALLLLGGGSQVAASYFEWRDPVGHITMTFPDAWVRVHDQKPDDRVTVQAPGERDYASCRLRQRRDARALIYPKAYERSLQHVYIGFAFWEAYVGEYSGAVLHRVLSDRGLMNTIAGSADFTFLSSSGPPTLMRGFAFAGYDRDRLYVFECSAEYHAYTRWHRTFKGILKSLRKDAGVQLYDNGAYRRFLSDPPLVIRGHSVFEDFR